MNGGWDISYEIALRWMPMDLTDKSRLVQVMAWCRQATSHYLSQLLPRSMSPNGVTRPQWVNNQSHTFLYFKLPMDSVISYHTYSKTSIISRAGVKYVFVFVFVFKYANICICIWKTTRWNICICIWLTYLGVFDKYFSNTLLIFTL